MPLLSDVVIFFSSIVVSTPNGNSLVVPVLLHSMSDTYPLHAPMFQSKDSPPSSGQKWVRKDNA